MRASLFISSSALIGALAAILAALPLHLHYPIIPYLRFEAAEVPVVLGFLILGPRVGLFSSVIYWVVLLFVGEFSPLGPTMKFAAVASMLIGLWLGFKTGRSPGFSLFAGSCMGCIFRVALMSLFNYVILLFVSPEFLGFAAGSISAALGISFPNNLAALAAVLVFTAIFNIIHVAVSIIPAYLLTRAILAFGRGAVESREIWYLKTVRAASRRSPQRS